MGKPSHYEVVHFRARDDSTGVGLNTDAGWNAAGEDSDWSQNVDETFRVRFVVNETNGATDDNTFTLQYDTGGGAATITGSTPVQYTSSARYTDGDATTHISDGGNGGMTAGTGTFFGGVGNESGNGNNANSTSVANGYTEVEWCLTIDSAQVSNNDTIDLTITTDVTIVNTTTPTVTVVKAGASNPRTATLTGTGDMTAARSALHPRAATLTGTGDLAAVSTHLYGASFTGTGDMSAARTAAHPRASSLTGTGDLVAARSAAHPRTATLTGTGDLAAVSIVSKKRTATLTGTGALAIAATARGKVATLTGTGDMAVARTSAHPRAATLTGTGSLAASLTLPRAATLTGTGSLSAALTLPRATTLTGTGSLAVALTLPRSAAFTGTGDMVAARTYTPGGGGGMEYPRTAALTGSGSLSTVLTLPRSAALSGGGSLAAAYTHTVPEPTYVAPYGKGDGAQIRPWVGLWNQAGIATAGVSNAGKADRQGGYPRSFVFGSVEDGEAWASGIKGVRSFATQTLNGNALVSARFRTAENARNGTFTFRTDGTADFVLYVWT